MARATRHAAELRSAIYNTVSFVYVPITANNVLDFPVHKYPRKSVSSSTSRINPSIILNRTVTNNIHSNAIWRIAGRFRKPTDSTCWKTFCKERKDGVWWRQNSADGRRGRVFRSRSQRRRGTIVNSTTIRRIGRWMEQQMVDRSSAKTFATTQRCDRCPHDIWKTLKSQIDEKPQGRISKRWGW